MSYTVNREVIVVALMALSASTIVGDDSLEIVSLCKNGSTKT
jgi:hypothetical protein